MKFYSFSRIVLSFFFVIGAAPTTASAVDIPNHSSSIFKFQQKLATKGNVHAQYKLATMYETGDGVKADIGQAKHWYGLAAEAGSQSAVQRNTYLDIKVNGFDAMRDAAWLSGVKADAGMHKAGGVYLLGQLYRDGIGVKKDLKKSLALFKQIKSLGEANVEKEIASINREMDAGRVVATQKRLLESKRTKEQAVREQKAIADKAIEQSEAAEKQATKTKQMAKKEQLAKAEKRKRYEAVMLKIKREQQLIDEQQSQASGEEVATIEDEI